MAHEPDPSGQGARTAQRAGLVYVTDTMPGIMRQRVGRKFRYLTPRRRMVDRKSVV